MFKVLAVIVFAVIVSFFAIIVFNRSTILSWKGLQGTNRQRQTNRQMNRQTDKQTDRWTNRQMNKQTKC